MIYTNILKLLDEDRNAGLEALFNNYADKLYGYAIEGWNFSEDDAWDLVYQTFDKLLVKLPECSFSNQSQFEGYIFQVFKSYLQKGYRKKKKEKERLEIVSLDEVCETSISFDDSDFFTDEPEKEQNIQLEALNSALSELKELDKQILLLRVQNFSYDKIANFLKIENNQLKVKHHRAKEKLIKILKTKQILK